MYAAPAYLARAGRPVSPQALDDDQHVVIGYRGSRTGAPLAHGELMPLFDDWQLEPMPLYLAFPPSRHMSRKLRAFIDWVVEVMGREGPEKQVPR